MEDALSPAERSHGLAEVVHGGGDALVDASHDPAAFSAQLPSGGGVALTSMNVKTLDASALSGLQQTGVYAGKQMLQGDYYKRDEPLFHIDLARKDARHAKALADSSGTSVKGLDVARARLDDVKVYLGDKGDIPSIYGAVRKESGLEFENAK